MRFKLFCIGFISFFSLTLLAQKAIDTVDTPMGKIVIFNNRTWSLLNESTFNGILNTRVHQEVQMYNPPFNQAWNNESCFTGKNNDLSRLTDTIILNLNYKTEDDFTIPVKGVVTSRYGFRSGRNHNGIDLGLNIGDTVRAAFSGKIRYAKFNDGGFGNLVIIRHHNGLETFYAHMSKLIVVPNQDVKSGEPIGLGGNTGRSFGPHLHFEVRFYDSPLNPEEIIDFTVKELKKPELTVNNALFRPGAKPSENFEVDPLAANENDTVVNVQPILKPVTKPPVKVPTVQVKYYKIKSGDTLTEIAARNNTTVSKLCQLNGIKPSTPIQVGRSLRVK